MLRYLKQVFNEENEGFNAYFAGGTLCLDLNNTVVLVNMRGKKFGWARGGERLLSKLEAYYLAKIIRKHKPNYLPIEVDKAIRAVEG